MTPDSSRRLCCLFFDDDPSFSGFFIKILMTEPWITVAAVTSPEQALEHVARKHTDLVLMDINLGEGVMDGIECLDEMRNRGFDGPAFI